jgi:phospholipid/cholesterol/gamma-HCH transport system substrate-binding protein
MSRASAREIRVGLIVVLALAGLLGFVALAGGGPGFLAHRRTIDVIFRDGQGIRAGSPVRVAGVDAGRVTAVELTPVEGVLRARVRLSVPADLAARLRADLKITIQASLTGQSLINIVDSGRSEQPLVPGQVVAGVETSFFDPVLEQVGLGPVERSHLSHTIAEVRQTVDAVGPRVRAILASLQDTAAQVRETAEAARPAVEAASGRVEEVARRIDAAKIEDTLNRIHLLVAHSESIVAENRKVVQMTLATIQQLASGVNGVIARDGPKVEALLTGLGGTRDRVDKLLTQTTVVAAQGSELLTANRVNLDRTVSNVRDATDYGNKLVQKLYGNPFYLSPFYKPTKEDLHAQEFYDTASTFMLGARELKDTVTALQAMQAKPMNQMTASEQNAYQQLFNRAWQLESQLQQSSQGLAEGLRTSTRR